MRTMIGSPTRWLIILPVLVAAVALLAIGCSGGGQSDQAEEEGGELFVDPSAPVIDVSLKEWAITPDASSAEAGPVTFSVKNSGSAEHEFVVLKTDTPASELVVQSGKIDEDTAGESMGEIEEFAAGDTVAKTFDLGPGHYVLVCNIEGHYGSGMHTDFTVE